MVPYSAGMDAIFKALADKGRRRLLERLRQHDAQSLSELCAGMDMTRPAVAKHVAILEEAGLLRVQWRGRRKIHFLNTTPLFQIKERWLEAFDRPERMAKKALDQALSGRKP